VSDSTASPQLSVYGRRVVDQARRINSHPNTLYRLMRRGLPATLVGGCWYIRDEDLDQYFAARSAERLGKPTPFDTKAHDDADRALNEAGW
jgi:hypothetical protein